MIGFVFGGRARQNVFPARRWGVLREIDQRLVHPSRHALLRRLTGSFIPCKLTVSGMGKPQKSLCTTVLFGKMELSCWAWCEAGGR